MRADGAWNARKVSGMRAEVLRDLRSVQKVRRSRGKFAEGAQKVRGRCAGGARKAFLFFFCLYLFFSVLFP